MILVKSNKRKYLDKKNLKGFRMSSLGMIFKKIDLITHVDPKLNPYRV